MKFSNLRQLFWSLPSALSRHALDWPAPVTTVNYVFVANSGGAADTSRWTDRDLRRRIGNRRLRTQAHGVDSGGVYPVPW